MPSSARRRATARPRRLPAPVTRATFPLNRFSMRQTYHTRTRSLRLTRHQRRVTLTIPRHANGAQMTLDLLAIAAHPDDVELTCGGTLLKMARRGYKTGILDLTAGEMGTRGTPETRAREAARAAKILKVSYRGGLEVPDSDVQPTRQHKLTLAQRIRELRPHTVILPYWEARHPD